jgi:drug/metabolite transporter (DMT)-like permease
MTILLAVGAAIGWGASDYFGGDASRRETPVFVIVAIAELIGALLITPMLVLRGAPPPPSPRLLMAVLAGVSVTVELSLIYRALGRGLAFITAPTGALGAALAVTFGLLSGDRLDAGVAIGLACALLGAGASGWAAPAAENASGESGWQILGICTGAALAVSVTLAALHTAGRADPLWATFTEHISTGVSAALAALVSRRRSPSQILRLAGQMPRLLLIATAGVGGDLAYTAASKGGAVSIVAAIASLYPVTTIVLGRLLQDQRPTRVQLAGCVAALLGAALLGIATG